MKKQVIKGERKSRKLILYSETLRILTPTELRHVEGGATGLLCGSSACTGSADCCDFH
jgi:hypothetical protein